LLNPSCKSERDFLFLQPMADEPKNDEIAPKKTSKEIVVDDSGEKIKTLETRVSDLQAKRQEDKTLIDGLTQYVESAKKIVSTRLPGKTLLDELDEFMGFNESANENPTPKV
jgi:hypothetical protein